jgi:hypothetical protein
MKASQLAAYRSGARDPSPATRERLKAAVGIPAEAWDEYPASEPAAPLPAVSQGSPRDHFEAAHAWRLALQQKGASARDVNAALSVEGKSLAVLTGNDARYPRLLTLVAVTLKDDYPAALEAVLSACREAGL